jgi:hypothetical protein
VDEYLSQREAANRLGITPRQVRNLLDKGVLASGTVAGRRLAFRDSVDALSRAGRQAGRPWAPNTIWAVALLLDGSGYEVGGAGDPDPYRVRRYAAGLSLRQWQWRARHRAMRVRVAADDDLVAFLHDRGPVAQGGLRGTPSSQHLYVSTRLLDLARRWRHVEEHPQGGLVLHAIRAFPSGSAGGVVPAPVGLLDLLDSGELARDEAESRWRAFPGVHPDETRGLSDA